MEALKKSYEPEVTLGLFAALGYAPQIVQDKLFDLLLSRATAVMTNVPGPQQPLYLAGSELKQIMFWVPQSGNIGMGVSILSFNGKVHFGLITDAGPGARSASHHRAVRAGIRALALFRADGAHGVKRRRTSDSAAAHVVASRTQSAVKA